MDRTQDAPVIFDRNLRDWLDEAIQDVSVEAKSVFEEFLRTNSVTSLRQVRSMARSFLTFIEDQHTPERIHFMTEFVRIQQAITKLDTTAARSTSLQGNSVLPLEEWACNDVWNWLSNLSVVQKISTDERMKFRELVLSSEMDGRSIQSNPDSIQDNHRFRFLPRQTRLSVWRSIKDLAQSNPKNDPSETKSPSSPRNTRTTPPTRTTESKRDESETITRDHMDYYRLIPRPPATSVSSTTTPDSRRVAASTLISSMMTDRDPMVLTFPPPSRPSREVSAESSEHDEPPPPSAEDAPPPTVTTRDPNDWDEKDVREDTNRLPRSMMNDHPWPPALLSLPIRFNRSNFSPDGAFDMTMDDPVRPEYKRTIRRRLDKLAMYDEEDNAFDDRYDDRMVRRVPRRKRGAISLRGIRGNRLRRRNRSPLRSTSTTATASSSMTSSFAPSAMTDTTDTPNPEDMLESYHHKDVFSWTNEDVCRWFCEVEIIKTLPSTDQANILETLRQLEITGSNIIHHTCRTIDGEGTPLKAALNPEYWEIVRQVFVDLMDFEALARPMHHRPSFTSISDFFNERRPMELSQLRSMQHSRLLATFGRSRSDPTPLEDDERYFREAARSLDAISNEKSSQKKNRSGRRDIELVSQLDFRPEASTVSLDVSQAELQAFLEQRDMNAERQEAEYQRFALSREYCALFQQDMDGSEIPPRNRRRVNGLWQLVCTEKRPFSSFPGPLPESIQVEIVWFLTGFEKRMESRALFIAMRSDLSSFCIEQATGCSATKAEYLFVHRYRQSIFDRVYESKQKDNFNRRLYGIQSLTDFQQDREARLRQRINLEER